MEMPYYDIDLIKYDLPLPPRLAEFLCISE
jgi:hypothetical protein